VLHRVRADHTTQLPDDKTVRAASSCRGVNRRVACSILPTFKKWTGIFTTYLNRMRSPENFNSFTHLFRSDGPETKMKRNQHATELKKCISFTLIESSRLRWKLCFERASKSQSAIRSLNTLHI
jgi:hypothetical protein